MDRADCTFFWSTHRTPDPMARDRGSRRPTREDLDLWRRATADVRRLSPAPPPIEPEQPAPADGARRPDGAGDGAGLRHPAKATIRRLMHGAAGTPHPTTMAERAAPIDRRTVRRLRRGDMPIDARLDLHGMRQEQAHLALAGFIRRCQADNKRVVLVITGTGLRREGSGVLRVQVPRWLNEPDLRRRVVALHPADRAHGGEGAFYVFLRRPGGR